MQIPSHIEEEMARQVTSERKRRELLKTMLASALKTYHQSNDQLTQDLLKK